MRAFVFALLLGSLLTTPVFGQQAENSGPLYYAGKHFVCDRPEEVGRFLALWDAELPLHHSALEASAVAMYKVNKEADKEDACAFVKIHGVYKGVVKEFTDTHNKVFQIIKLEILASSVVLSDGRRVFGHFRVPPTWYSFRGSGDTAL